jgi:hypothetical protein
MRKGYVQEWTLGEIEVRIENLPNGLTRYFLNDEEVDYVDVQCDYGSYPHRYDFTIIPGDDRRIARGFSQTTIEEMPVPYRIKRETEALYTKIKRSEERLAEIRETCKHENTKKTNYSWRVGSIRPAIVCDDCGHLIKMLDGPLILNNDI